MSYMENFSEMEDPRDYNTAPRGWCPVCGEECSDLMMDASGWCPEHGKVYVEWAPPEKVPVEEEEEE